MNTKYLLGMVLLCAICLNGVAQVSYNKRAMGVIGDTPKAGDFLNGATLDDVDKSTGTLRIGIPLYEIKVNDISVPITLNYTALGLKVGQEAGIAGMGWELSAGGKIITNIQGKRDESSNGIYLHPFPEPFNYFSAVGASPNPDHKALFNNIIDGKKDNAWDTYNYVLPNGGGSYTANGLTYPYDPTIKIDHYNSKINTADGLVYSFVPGDRKRTSKVINYASQTNTIPTYNPNLADPDPTVWSDYNLSTITSTRFKDVVNFKYRYMGEVGYYGPRLLAKRRINVSESLPLYRDVKAVSDVYGGWQQDPNDHKYNIKEPLVSKSITDYVSHAVLDTIDFSTGKVVFEYDANDILGRDVLRNIRIYKKEADNSVTMLKRYYFEYQGDTQYGHYLSRINILDGKDVYQGKWAFDYMGTNLPVVPNSGSMAQDRWGFFNNKTSNQTLLEHPDDNLALLSFTHFPIVVGPYPIQYTRPENIAFYGYGTSVAQVGNVFTYGIQFADRRYVFEHAVRGTLSSVKTPLGATYEYHYQPHKYRYTKKFGVPEEPLYEVRDEEGAGIRIESIVKLRGHSDQYYSSSTSETNVKKQYRYGDYELLDRNNSYDPETHEGLVVLSDPALTSGLGQISIPCSIVGNLSAYYRNGHTTNDMDYAHYEYVKNLMLLSHPINDLVQNNGSYVTYRCVTEELLQSEGVTASHGKTIYFSHLPLFDPYATGGYFGPYPSGSTPNPYTSNQGPDSNYPYAPYLSTNLGVSLPVGADIYGIYQYRYKNGSYLLASTTNYQYQFFPSPQADEYRLINYYAALTGQSSGPYPVNPASAPPLKNPPSEYHRGNVVDWIYDTRYDSGSNGTMDYLTATYLADQSYIEDYPYRYAVKSYNMNNFSYCVKKSKETTIVYGYDKGRSNISMVDYHYDNPAHYLPTMIAKTTMNYQDLGTPRPRHDTLFTRILYPMDYPVALNTGLGAFIRDTKMGFTEPIAQYTLYKSGTSNAEKLMGGTITTLKIYDDAIVPDKTYKLTPPDQYDFINTPNLDIWHYFNYAPDTTMYKQIMSYDKYVKGQVHQYTELAGRPSVILWGYKNQYPIAKVTNAGNVDLYNAVNSTYTSADVAYTSFEVRDTCNWIYAGTIVSDDTSPSGKKAYQLNTGTISKVNPTVSGKYIVSYWYKTGADVTVGGGTVTAPVIKNRRGSWVLAEQEISAVTGAVTVSGSGLIDELRFHPKDAQMTTFLYDPLIGLTCTIDANGRSQYYEYDDSQRLKQIRDQNGNLVKAYQYVIGSAN